MFSCKLFKRWLGREDFNFMKKFTLNNISLIKTKAKVRLTGIKRLYTGFTLMAHGGTVVVQLRFLCSVVKKSLENLINLTRKPYSDNLVLHGKSVSKFILSCKTKAQSSTVTSGGRQRVRLASSSVAWPSSVISNIRLDNRGPTDTVLKYIK